MVTQSQPVLDGSEFVALVKSGYHWLDQYSLAINALNIFSYPDYDTGTNLSLTTLCALQETSGIAESGVDIRMNALAHGALMGARGNAGVILSQLFRGIAREIDGRQTLDLTSFAEAMRSGSETAYRGVIRPVEGTILTVAKQTAESLLVEAKAGWKQLLLLMSRSAREAAKKSARNVTDLGCIWRHRCWRAWPLNSV